MKLEEKIIQLRKSKNWSQEELAYQLDVSRQAVSKWESGQSIPDINKIVMLAGSIVYGAVEALFSKRK